MRMALAATLLMVVAGTALAFVVSWRIDLERSEQRSAEQSERPEHQEEETTEQRTKRFACALDDMKAHGECNPPEEYDAGSEASVVCYATASAAVEPGKTTCYHDDPTGFSARPWP
jgi:hypothetical protein